ncbi:MAG: heparinase II/III family protein [Armatimonadia bacterium]
MTKAIALLVLLGLCAQVGAQTVPWLGQIRRDHPRLYFNADTWPAVKARAEGVMAQQLEKVRKAGELPVSKYEWSAIQRPPTRAGSSFEARDYGDRLMNQAFVYRITSDAASLQKIREMLWASLDYYHACTAQGKSVNWYARSRMGWLCALDWVWNDLQPQERQELAASFLKHVNEILTGKLLQRQNRSGPATGYYGDDNLALFTGLALYGEGIDDAAAAKLIEQGYTTYQKLLAHRAEMCGDDGGAASATLGYSLADYPLAEWNYLHCLKSAAGIDDSAKWPYLATFANYVLWNVLPGLLEYGYGDTPHKDNRLSRWLMYTHMAHVRHFYGQSQPEAAALAGYVGGLFPEYFNDAIWCVYPFLLTGLEQAPPPQDPGKLPPARFFEMMGQVFMRSGSGPEDTYALFTAGAKTNQHTHFDATNFVMYKRGYLALDTGTREGNTDNLQNYFAQTIAHNCVLIKMPGEPPTQYWNGKVTAQPGGQNSQVGSKIIAFETNPLYTYVAADATPVYSAEKCRQMVRQFIFVMPDYFVVFDRVAATKPEFAKTWLLHFANEPQLQGRVARADQGEGRIFCQTLLPGDASVEKVGGPGKEFLADGVNYSITAGPAEEIKKAEYTGIKPLEYKEVPELMGRWRLEVKPGAARAEDVFLHLLQVGDNKLEGMTEGKVETRDGQAVLRFEAAGKQVTVTLATSGPVGGAIKIEQGGKVLVERALTETVMAQEGVAAQ